jgi:hypothetical protein
MQIVGANCNVCDRKISFAPDAGECPDCEVIFHKNCLEDPQRCPKCGADYSQRLRAHLDIANKQSVADVEGGRRIILVCGVALVGLQLMVTLSRLFEGTSGAVLDAVRLTLLLLAFLFLYLGFRWARLWLTIVLGLAVLTSVGGTIKGIRTADMPLLITGGLLSVVYGAIFVYVAFSPRVTRYIESFPRRLT